MCAYVSDVCTYVCVNYALDINGISDQSDVDLRHSIANMVAMVIGCPSHSNHLWYHMFVADKLVNTYMTGFMVSIYKEKEGGIERERERERESLGRER